MTNHASRVFNFSAGPAVLPLAVIEQVQEEMLCLPGGGASIMEISHRSKVFDAIINEAVANIKELLGLSDEYHVLFVGGGASTQFANIPANLLKKDETANYIITGTWGKKALAEAKHFANTNVAWDGKADNYNHIPADAELQLDPNAVYTHFTSNETIQGVEFQTEPTGVGPLICDSSSDFLSRPIDVSKYGLIYAGAQKNVGPAGVTIVIIRDDMIARIPDGLPTMMDYRTHVKNNSLYNTPPAFAIYVINLVTRWLKQNGGLVGIQKMNQEKASWLYDVIDSSNGYYKGHSAKDCRSMMNVTWRLPSEELEAKFVADAKAVGLWELKGHRSVGGIRASIYNAMPAEGVKTLVQFMKEFQAQNG